MEKRKRSEKGVIIIFAIIFMFLCFMAGGTYLVIINNECRLIEKEIKSIRSFYLSEAGLEYGYWKVKKDGDTH